MGKTWFAVLMIAGWSLAGVAANAEQPSFKRGATIVEFFAFPAISGEGPARTYASPAYPHALSSLSLFDFDELRSDGFDHLRIEFDMGPLLDGNEIQRRQILSDLVDVVSAISRHRLSVLVTLFTPTLHHETTATYLDDIKGPQFTAYLAMVERVSTALASVKTGTVALEPMNEPQARCRVRFGTDWTDFQDFMVGQLRRIAPDMPLFLTGACASDIGGVALLDGDTLRDRRNYVSVHFYYPFLFTHQSATWTLPYMIGTIGVPFPASAGSLDETLSLTRDRFKTVTLPAGVDRRGAQMQAEAQIRR